MSEKSSKPKLDLSKLNIVDVATIPAKSTKGVWQSWIKILQDLVKTPTKAISITEKEASLPALRNQLAKAIKNGNIEGIIINTRNINKVQTLFISYKKPVVKK
jgi:hypothetical protein